MPRGDRTGPTGLGPRTGRGLGYCGAYDVPGFADRAFGLSWRRGWGGFGWRHRFTPLTKEETLRALTSEADWLQEELKAISKRIKQLEE